MQALVIVLNEVEYLNDVLTALRDAGVKGATILDSVGFGRTGFQAQQYLPLIAGLMKGVETARPHNRTVFSVIDDDSVAELAIAGVEKVLGDLSKPGKGIMFTVPVSRAFGLNRAELRHHVSERRKS